MRNSSSTLFTFGLCLIFIAVTSSGTCRNGTYRNVVNASNDTWKRKRGEDTNADIRNQQAAYRKFLAMQVAAMGQRFQTTPLKPCCTGSGNLKSTRAPLASSHVAPHCHVTLPVTLPFTPSELPLYVVISARTWRSFTTRTWRIRISTLTTPSFTIFPLVIPSSRTNFRLSLSSLKTNFSLSIPTLITNFRISTVTLSTNFSPSTTSRRTSPTQFKKMTSSNASSLTSRVAPRALNCTCGVTSAEKCSDVTMTYYIGRTRVTLPGKCCEVTSLSNGTAKSEMTSLNNCTASPSKCTAKQCCGVTSADKCTAELLKCCGGTCGTPSLKNYLKCTTTGSKMCTCKCQMTSADKCTCVTSDGDGTGTTLLNCTAKISKTVTSGMKLHCNTNVPKACGCKCQMTSADKCPGVTSNALTSGSEGTGITSVKACTCQMMSCRINCKGQRQAQSEPYLPIYDDDVIKGLKKQLMTTGKPEMKWMVSKFNRKSYSLRQPERWSTCRHVVLQYRTTCQMFYKEISEEKTIGLISILEYFPPKRGLGNFTCDQS